jgi:tetratricopeptide (TPR) repeat protein
VGTNRILASEKPFGLVQEISKRDIQYSLKKQYVVLGLLSGERARMTEDNLTSEAEVREALQRAYAHEDCQELIPAREIFENLFDGENSVIAAHLGYIHNQSGSTEYDLQKAERYFLITVQDGNPYAHQGLGTNYQKQGNIDKAIYHYTEANKAGRAKCSMALYDLYKDREDTKRTREALERAVEQGHPVAIQRRSIDDMLLRNGGGNVFRGIRRYFANIPNLTKYVKDNAHQW